MEEERSPEPNPNGTVDSLIGRTVAPVARAGLQGARGVARRLGLDRAIDRSVDRALDSETAARATERFLDNETTKRVWDKVLESEEAQKLVERVADAPEVRAAIAQQGVGLLQDLRRGVRNAARQIDTVLERVARVILRRAPRERRPIFAGAFTRLLALAIDAGVVYGSLLVISAALAFLVSVFESGDQHAGTVVIAIGATIWILVAGTYLLVLWSGAGRTVGMSFVAIRMLAEDGSPVRPGQAIRRLVWLPLAALPLLLGYWGVFFDQGAPRLAGPQGADDRLLRGPGAGQGPGLARLVQQLVRLRPLAGRDAQRDVAAAVLVHWVVGGDHRLVPCIGELLAPGAGGLEVVEVADHVPVVVGGVADVELGQSVGMQRVVADAEELAELVAEAHHQRSASSASRPGAT